MVYMRKNVPTKPDAKYKLVNFITRLYERKVLAERDKCRNGVFYPEFLIIDAEKKRGNFKNNIENQKVKTLC